MTLEVVDGDQRDLECQSQALGRGQTHDERTHQTRPGSDRHRPQIGERHARLAQGFVDRRQHLPDMFARCDLRNHAPEPPVQPDLRGDDTRTYPWNARGRRRRPFQDRRGRLVASCLDGQKNQG